MPRLTTNENVVTGLYTDLDLEDPVVVFDYLWTRLDPEVTVYPSEGYYYFQIPIRGVTVKGALTLFAFDRDRGIVGFGYSGEIEDHPRGLHADMPGRFRQFGAADGLQLVDEGPFTSRVRWRDREILFHFYDPGMVGPGPEHLAPHETYVGSNFDESGLRFHLVFNDLENRLFWILDERSFVPEAMIAVDGYVAIGARTHFAFFCDETYHRKVLVGVDVQEISFNSWYDGPFDQLPDVYIRQGKIPIKDYIVAHTGIDPDRLDRYGNFLDVPGTRAPITPYRFYQEPEELGFVNDLVSQRDAGTIDEAEFYARLTQEAGREILLGDASPDEENGSEAVR
ncbi:MAG: hypothetical protein KC729_06030 [Candidatus Eisenbacteria bacterium]|uniref:Uncharacterized protein n=1 Tax=Eiseniibacteriota bacterium TaxID=2212470 RepID=A0A956LX76_UNCEI|nr:hypothetical protein [Candidatus Eisenbacteria bacterium]